MAFTIPFTATAIIIKINFVVCDFGDSVLATGLVGGKLGEFLVENIDDQVKKDFFSIQGETRNCIAILHGDNQTEVLEKGPEVLEQEGQDFLEHFKKCGQILPSF